MSKTSAILAAALAGLGGLLAACASAPQPPRAPPPGGPAAAPRARLFISPAGQPFRSRPGQEAPIEAWWRQVDKNGDGVVTPEEFRADFDSFFKLLDRDGDGAIDGFEVSIYENDLVPEILPEVGQRNSLGEPMRSPAQRSRGGRRGGGFGASAGGVGPGFGGGQGAAPYGLVPDPEPIMAADYDVSRRVSLAEFERRARDVFALLDTGHDGKLTLAELPRPPEPGQGDEGGARAAERAFWAPGRRRPLRACISPPRSNADPIRRSWAEAWT